MDYNKLQIPYQYRFYITSKFIDNDIFINRIELDNNKIKLFSDHNNEVGRMNLVDIKSEGYDKPMQSFRINANSIKLLKQCIEEYRPEWLY
jgi:hypothetical protein